MYSAPKRHLKTLLQVLGEELRKLPMAEPDDRMAQAIEQAVEQLLANARMRDERGGEPGQPLQCA